MSRFLFILPKILNGSQYRYRLVVHILDRSLLLRSLVLGPKIFDLIPPPPVRKVTLGEGGWKGGGRVDSAGAYKLRIRDWHTFQFPLHKKGTIEYPRSDQFCAPPLRELSTVIWTPDPGAP